MNDKILLLKRLCVIALLCHYVVATIYYVDVQGSDEGDCSADDPCSGLLFLPVLQDGDEVIVASGTYTPPNNFPYTISAQNVTLTGSGDDTIFSCGVTAQDDHCLTITLQISFLNNTVTLNNIRFSDYNVTLPFSHDITGGQSLIYVNSMIDAENFNTSNWNASIPHHQFWQRISQRLVISSCVFSKNFNQVPIFESSEQLMIVPSCDAAAVLVDKVSGSASVFITNSTFALMNITSIVSSYSSVTVDSCIFDNVTGLAAGQVIYATVSDGEHVNITNSNFTAVGLTIMIPFNYSYPQVPMVLLSGSNCHRSPVQDHLSCRPFAVTSCVFEAPYSVVGIRLTNAAYLSVNYTAFNTDFYGNFWVLDSDSPGALLQVYESSFYGQTVIGGLYSPGSIIRDSSFTDIDDSRNPGISLTSGTSMVVDNCVFLEYGSNSFFSGGSELNFPASIQISNSQINSNNGAGFSFSSQSSSPLLISMVNNTFTFDDSETYFSIYGPAVLSFGSNKLTSTWNPPENFVMCGSIQNDPIIYAVVLFVGDENSNFPAQADYKNNCYYSCNDANQDICVNGYTLSPDQQHSDTFAYVSISLFAVCAVYAVIITIVAIVLGYLVYKFRSRFDTIL